MRLKLPVLIITGAITLPVYSQDTTTSSTPVIELHGINLRATSYYTNSEVHEDDLQLKKCRRSTACLAWDTRGLHQPIK